MNRETPALSERLEFPFPLREVHAGIPLANGVFGALIWGGEGELRITLNRADYWDHRGGLEFTEEATYANLRQWLEEGNEARLREVFEGRREAAPGVPPRPTRLPMGRVDLGLPPNWDVISGGLYLKTSEAEIEVARRIRPGLRAATGPRRPGEEARVRAILLRDTPVLCLRVTGLDSDELAFHGRPPESREVLAQFQQYGIPAAQPFDFEEMAGWVQECPGETALCVAWMRTRSAGGVL
ncbi:MAG: hypothetical protein FJX77_11845, partial [Armatimonadetes bacterium]|nr:hypothetical protein [Armatimonadota bacterium]